MRLIGNVETSLEKFVLEQRSKSKNWVGMEDLLVTQYQSRLEDVLGSKAYTRFNDLEPEQKYNGIHDVNDTKIKNLMKTHFFPFLFTFDTNCR